MKRNHRMLPFVLMLLFLFLLTACVHEHNYGEWIVERETTCTLGGTKVRKCAICGEKETITMAKSNKSHKFGEWETASEATCTDSGEMRKKCTLCSYEEISTISPKNHNFKGGVCTSCNIRDLDSTNDVHYVWYDADNSILYEEYIEQSQQPTDFPLPEDNNKWDYIEWQQGDSTTEKIAARTLKESYFVGNVFQIIVKDLGETPVATGSAFVFHKDGWFITNAHVMEDAYYAQAIFNIPNSAAGESFTYLDIIYGSYFHLDKDIYIGKIENYSSIQSYYNEIPVNLSYEIGDKTYSVGYPESSTELVFAEGVITENWSDLYEKLYSGNSYICSTSYIAPGSSGGILVNENLEVIGITTLGWTDKKDNFISGAAISAFNFTGLLNTNTNNLIPLLKQFHEDEMVYICFFNWARFDEETERIVFDDGTIGYEYSWITEGKAYYSETFLIITSDGYIEFTDEIYWEDGDRRTIAFYGYFLGKNNFSDFIYEFDYKWGTGNYYGIYCDNINYSENIALTLNRYEISKKSYNYSVSQSNIEYAKEQFNITYEWLTAWMAEFE